MFVILTKINDDESKSGELLKLNCGYLNHEIDIYFYKMGSLKNFRSKIIDNKAF